MHGIRAVRHESGNKDPLSREAPRVLFMASTVGRVSACRLCGDLTADQSGYDFVVTFSCFLTPPSPGAPP